MCPIRAPEGTSSSSGGIAVRLVTRKKENNYSHVHCAKLLTMFYETCAMRVSVFSIHHLQPFLSQN